MIALLQDRDIHLEGFARLAPEIVLVSLSLVVLVMDLVWKERHSRRLGWISIAGLGLTAFLLMAAFGSSNGETAFGIVVIDKFGNFFKLFTCAALAVVTFFVMSDRHQRQDRIGEYYFLLLGAGIGIFFMVSTNNLLLLVLGLELLSLASYALAGFHKSERSSAEASMKYVVFGGVSTGVLLYGISLLYGLTATLDLRVMAGVAQGEAQGGILTRSLATAITDSPGAVALAMVLILGGFSYKIAVAPFHFWAPDVYEGAPTPVTTFLAVASKAAGFGALLRFIAVLFLSPSAAEAVATYGLEVGALIAILAAVTMAVGNLAALRQESVKRMLAYSSVAHAGYVLVGVAAMTTAGFQAAMLYLVAYYLMNLGAFGFLLYFHGQTGEETYESLNGLGFRAPMVSIAMVVFLISLTGLPPTIGFFGKYKLMETVYNVQEGRYGWLVLWMLLNSVVSLYFYMRVAKHLFLKEVSDRTIQPQNAFVGLLVVLAVLNVVFLLYSTPLVTWTQTSMDLVPG